MVARVMLDTGGGVGGVVVDGGGGVVVDGGLDFR